MSVEKKKPVTFPLRAVPHDIMKIIYLEQAQMKIEGLKKTSLEWAIYRIIKRDNEARNK